jgi:hypothetical protein
MRLCWQNQSRSPHGQTEKTYSPAGEEQQKKNQQEQWN